MRSFDETPEDVCQVCGTDRAEIESWEPCDTCGTYESDVTGYARLLELRTEHRKRCIDDFRAKSRHWFLMRDARAGTRAAFAAVGLKVPWS